MAHTLVLQLPDDVHEALLRRAEEARRTPEEVAGDCVAAALRPAVDLTSVLELAGFLDIDPGDAFLDHDRHLGQAAAGKPEPATHG